MRNPESVDTRDGHVRQVSITRSYGRTATDWMKRRVDSQLGKQIYGHRMSVIEPVFGNIGTNKRRNRFFRGAKIKCRGNGACFVW
jgi:4-aminobutyrate aminotransferase-like enzyme